MRTSIAVAALPILLAACGGPGPIQETGTSVPRRDLTLSTTSIAAAQVASKIELVPERLTRHNRPRPSPEPRVEREPEVPLTSPAPASITHPIAAPETASAPAAEAPPPDPTGRELAPGATVTILPVSSPASNAGTSGEWSEVPAPRSRGGVMIGGGHGGHCGGGRGRGPVAILK